MSIQGYNETLISDFGVFRVSADEVAITQLELIEPSEQLPSDNPSPLTREAIAQLTQYLDGSLTQFDLPLSQIGTEFQQTVWTKLQIIPYGKTISYGDLAKSIDKVNAVRAVGAANGRNRIPIIIPCHRVIASSGKLQGYALGIDLKRRLLDLERRKSPNYLF